MSLGDDVLDNWEELDEAGLCMTLQTKLQTATDTAASTPTPGCLSSKPETAATGKSQAAAATKMKVLQRSQTLQEPTSSAAKQITIAKKPPASDGPEIDAPVLMVLHKSTSEYDAASYANPISNQTVKILRRPAQAEERRDPNGMRPKQPIKTLQQREQEYAEARLRILGAAKNPEDDKPPGTTTTAASNSTTPPALPAIANNINNNNNNNINNGGMQHVTSMQHVPGMQHVTGMHRSNSAPKMLPTPQTNYNSYNNYFQAPPMAPSLNYFYQQNVQPLPPQQQAPMQHYNQRMPPQVNQPQSINAQQTWSPVVGGSVSAALLRQQQQAMVQQPAPQQPPNLYNDNILRLPRGPCPNGSLGFQMRR